MGCGLSLVYMGWWCLVEVFFGKLAIWIFVRGPILSVALDLFLIDMMLGLPFWLSDPITFRASTTGGMNSLWPLGF